MSDDIQKMQSIVDECDEIQRIIEANGALGLSLAASLFRLALNEPESESPSNAHLVAKTFINLMKKGAE